MVVPDQVWFEIDLAPVDNANVLPSKESPVFIKHTPKANETGDPFTILVVDAEPIFTLQ